MFAPGGAVAGIHDRIDDVAVVQRFLRLPAFVHGVEHVTEHVDVAEFGDLVTDREEPAGFGLGLLCDIPAASAGGEHLVAGSEEMVHPDRPVGPGHLIAQIHPSAEGPTDFELADRPRLEPDESDRVVFVIDRVNERVGPAHQFDRSIVLADEVADDLDAMATEIDDGAPARQAPVPKPRRMRAGVGLPRSDPGDIAHRASFDGADGLERLGGITKVLEVSGEHPRLLDAVEDPLRFLGRASQWLGAENRFAGRGREGNRFLVEMVGEADHHDIGLGMVDRLFHRGGRPGHAPSLAEGVVPVPHSGNRPPPTRSRPR